MHRNKHIEPNTLTNTDLTRRALTSPSGLPLPGIKVTQYAQAMAQAAASDAR